MQRIQDLYLTWGICKVLLKSANNNKNLSLNTQNNTCVATPSQTLDNQRWSFIKQSDGTYMIFNSSGDWATRQSGTTYGKNYIGIETTGNTVKMCSDGSNKWRLVMNSDSTYSFVNADNGKYLTLNSNLTDVQALPSANTTNQKWKLETAKKDICVGGMYLPDQFLHSWTDRSNWVDNTVLAACNNIGYSTCTYFRKGSSMEVRDMIRRSSVFVINTHGNTNFIACNTYEYPTKIENRSYLTSNLTRSDCTSVLDLPDNCFATTRLVFLSACLTAGEDSPNLVTALSQKGVQTVMGFKKATISGPDKIYLREFITSLGNGQTLGQAIVNAEQAIVAADLYWGGMMGDNLVIMGNTDLTATFRY